MPRREQVVISGIVLAAGTSSRLGRPKQVLDLGGRPVLQHVVDAAADASLDEILVVVGHAADEIATSVRLPPRARFVTNEDFAMGQSTSLRTGLRGADPRAMAAMVVLGDQPGVRPEVLATVMAAWREGAGPVVQASYGGQRSHPMLFDRSVWPALEEAEGDEGARGVLAANPSWVVGVEVGGPPPEDIDTEEDYARAREAFGSG